MGDPVATYSDTMFELTYEISDREIYNDIRSAIDVTEETETSIPGAPAGYGQEAINRQTGVLQPGAYQDITFNSSSVPAAQRTELTWISVSTSPNVVTIYDLDQAVCEAAGGSYFPPYDPVNPSSSHSTCYLTQNTFFASFTANSGTSCTVRITNNSTYATRVPYSITYQYLATAAGQTVTTTSTTQHTMQVRATDDTSIAYYGRRVMNLPWPLGQTQEQMQALVETYLTRYKDPYPQFYVSIIGKTDALIAEILARKISEKIALVNTNLGLSRNFFINSVNIDHEGGGLIKATYLVEAVRDYEGAGLFVLDTGVLDGDLILGW